MNTGKRKVRAPSLCYGVHGALTRRNRRAQDVTGRPSRDHERVEAIRDSDVSPG